MQARARLGLLTAFAALMLFTGAPLAHADALTLTSGSNATTTPNVATSITGFQIVGNAASTSPVKIHVTSGTVHVPTVSGVTMSGNDSATLNLSGTVTNLNTALSGLTYTRSSTGTDTLEVALVNSDQIYFPTNGHVYQYVASALSWNAADTTALTLSAYGVPGYLVTITSSTENDFVKARLSGNAWIGASDSITEGDWKWVTGPEAGTSFWSGASGGHTVGGNYASWNGGEPNDSGGNEDCGEEYVADGTWNDLPCTGTTVDGYVAEFGSGSTLPNVVSKNVSIVTADVPAVTSLSPASGATNVSPTANLVIGFSKTVSADTGNILIKKASDDTLVESIVASSSQVTGSGTNTITINPNTTLPEGVSYYVLIPNTAFKDTSNNHFDGIAATSTWAFSVPDLTAPVLSSVTATTTATTTERVTWTTNEQGSSKVVYSTDSSYASTTAQTDTSPRVTSHTVNLSGLIACTFYKYEVISADASLNYATSTGSSFTTTGCPGNVSPTSATTSSVTVSVAATTTLTDSGHTLSVTTPANFTATSSTVVIQIKALDSATSFASTSMPGGSLTSAASVVFDVTALINSNTVLDSFDAPVTISYTYTDAEVAGLVESTLTMYHYHNGAWLPLNSCSVNTGTNTITCTAPSFSIFAIFGTAPVSSHGGSTYVSIPVQVTTLLAQGKTASANALMQEFPELFSTKIAQAAAVVTNTTVRDLKLGMTGDDVKALQKLLIANAPSTEALKLSGVGATGYFGSYTKNALAAYQKKNAIAPSVGYFGSLTRAHVKSAGLSGLWW